MEPYPSPELDDYRPLCDLAGCQNAAVEDGVVSYAVVELGRVVRFRVCGYHLVALREQGVTSAYR